MCLRWESWMKQWSDRQLPLVVVSRFWLRGKKRIQRQSTIGLSRKVLLKHSGLCTWRGSAGNLREEAPSRTQEVTWRNQEFCLSPSLGSAFFPPTASGSCSNYFITVSSSTSASLIVSGSAQVIAPSPNQLCFPSAISGLGAWPWNLQQRVRVVKDDASKSKTWALLEKTVGRMPSRQNSENCNTMTSYHCSACV